MNKKNIYSILLVVGLLTFFFVKSKFSVMPEYVAQHSQYSYQGKNTNSPAQYSYFFNINNEEEDELLHISKATVLLIFLSSFLLKSNLISSKIKFETRPITLYFGIPTYLTVRNFRI